MARAKSTKSKKLVIYHSSCPDGFGAAWAAWKKFGTRAEYRATPHGEQPIDCRGREVYFLDFTHKPPAMRKIVKEAKQVVVIDHHLSAADSVAVVEESVYDLKHSGAVLAWKYFHARKKIPRILLHIEDEDIWKFKLRHTAAVNAHLELLEFDFKAFDKVVSGFERAAFRKQFIKEGSLLKDYRSRLVRRLVAENAVPVRFAGYRTLAVNAIRPFTSEIGHMLYEMRPPIGIVWQERPGRIAVSLRSNGKVDVSRIAARFGGGGHKAAAAFVLPTGAKKPWTYEQKSARKNRKK